MGKVLAWHFLANDGTTCDGTKPAPGGTERYVGPLQMCEFGLHGSRQLLDALDYARGSILRRVTLSGEVVEDQDKVVAEVREEHWRMNIAPVLHEFACREAEDALRQVGVKDERAWNAIRVKRWWLRGEATDVELSSAREGAKAAAKDAVRGAGWVGANAAAKVAVRDAVRDAVWAAEDAARAAAEDAAGNAAWTAWGAWDVAWEATKKRQNCRLTAMVAAARKKEGKK
jgi:hypothetical protein